MKKLILALSAAACLILTSCEVEVRDGVSYHHHRGWEHQTHPDHHEEYNHGYHHDRDGGEIHFERHD